MKSMHFELTDRYLLAVYVFLRQHEDNLDAVQARVLQDLQKEVFQGMTLEEVEQIEAIYSEKM